MFLLLCLVDDQRSERDSYDRISLLPDGERGSSASRKALVDDRVFRKLLKSVCEVLLVFCRVY